MEPAATTHQIRNVPACQHYYVEPNALWTHLRMSLQLLRTVFRKKNGSEVDHAIANHGKKPRQSDAEDDMIKSVAVIPYCGTIMNRPSRLLYCTGIQTVSLPLVKIKQLLRSVQDHLGLNILGVYKISCACGLYYIGQMGRSILVIQKEHQHHLRLGHKEKSALYYNQHLC